MAERDSDEQGEDFSSKGPDKDSFDLRELLTLTAACKILPTRRQGKRPDSSTLHRWARKGLKGRYLRTTKVGSTLCTTERWLAAFFEELEHD